MDTYNHNQSIPLFLGEANQNVNPLRVGLQTQMSGGKGVTVMGNFFLIFTVGK